MTGRLFYLPLPKQVELDDAIESQQYGAICIGGHRNSGKSDTLRRLCYRLCQRFPEFSVIFLRREFPELQLNHIRFAILEAKRLGAKYASKTVTFPDTDSQLIFGHCHEKDDFKHYVGGDVDLIVFEQIEQFEREQVMEIAASTGRTRKRSDWRGLWLGGENPGGPLSAYIEELFIKKDVDREQYPDYNPTQFHFIPARLEDNPYADPRYVNNLAGLSPARRAMFRFGRRDVFPRQYFKTFLRPDRVQRIEVSPTIPRLCAIHWGFFKPGMFLWAVVLPDGRLYIEREHEFSETVATQVAKAIGDLNTQQRITMQAVWGNPVSDVAADDLGEHTFETLFLHGVPVIRSYHDPINGWQRLQHWLEPMITPTGELPALIISPDCPILARTVPQLLQASNDPEDVDDSGATHAAKALRYLVMSRPEPPMTQPKPPGRDLSLLDARTRAEIEYLRQCEADTKPADALSMGEFWG